MTNIDQQTLSTFCKIEFNRIMVKIKDRSIKGISRSYTTEKTAGLTALVNSRGYLEIAVPMGNAARDLGISTDEPVYLELKNQTS